MTTKRSRKKTARLRAAKPTAKAPSRLAEYRRKRDFSRTAEPSGGRRKAARKLAYVIQKHAASHLHYDLRLELDGVMKSWAVPKGPSLDPAIKRLAMQVEDHPIEYNRFEGTIPQGEYGGGTVMIWDRGTYTYGGNDDGDPVEALRRGYEKGDFKVVLRGDRCLNGVPVDRGLIRDREPVVPGEYERFCRDGGEPRAHGAHRHDRRDVSPDETSMGRGARQDGSAGGCQSG